MDGGSVDGHRSGVSPDLSIVSVCDFFGTYFLQTPVGKSMDLGSRYFGTFVNFEDFPTSVGKFVQNHKIVILDRSRMIALGYVVCRCHW